MCFAVWSEWRCAIWSGFLPKYYKLGDTGIWLFDLDRVATSTWMTGIITDEPYEFVDEEEVIQ